MADRPRYYSNDDLSIGVTASQLKRLRKAKQLEYMTYWFHRNFENPAEETPYESAEGGYLYIWGGPYEAKDELFSEFGSIIREDRIDEVVEKVESDGLTDWAPGPEHPSQIQRAEDWAAEHENDEVGIPDVDLDLVIRDLQSGRKPTFGDKIDLNLRQKVLDDIAQLAKALDENKPHGRIGHNNPPPDKASSSIISIAEIREAAETIQKNLFVAEPDALVVANATSRLKGAFHWLGKKGDVWVDGFAKESGGVAGKWLTRAAGAYAISKIPGVGTLINSVITSASQWLNHVTIPF